MDDLMLEQFFDQYIKNVPWRMLDLVQQVPLSDDLQTDTATVTPDTSTLDLSSQGSGAGEDLRAPSVVQPSISSIHPTMFVPQSPGIPLKIQNVVAMASLGCRLDLNLIAHKAKNVEFRPRKTNTLTMRIRRPRTTALLHWSGKVVCIGAQSEEQARLATRRFGRIMQKFGFPARFLGFRIVNVVGTCKTFPLVLQELALHPKSSYEPEIFPGLFYRLKPGVTACIFSSGKVSVAGAKSEAEVKEALGMLYPVLSSVRKG